MKKITILFIGIIISFSTQARDTVKLGECEILQIDSIPLCLSHYSITVLTSVDTFTTIVSKSVIRKPISSLIGAIKTIIVKPIDSLTLSMSNSQLTLSLIESQVSHRDYSKYDHIVYEWKIRKSFWKNVNIRLKLSYFYLNTKQMNLLVTKIE